MSSGPLAAPGARLSLKNVAMLLAVLLQLLGGVFAYGRLVERVENLQNDVRELRQLILQREVVRR